MEFNLKIIFIFQSYLQKSTPPPGRIPTRPSPSTAISQRTASFHPATIRHNLKIHPPNGRASKSLNGRSRADWSENSSIDTFPKAHQPHSTIKRHIYDSCPLRLDRPTPCNRRFNFWPSPRLANRRDSFILCFVNCFVLTGDLIHYFSEFL